MSAYVPGGGEVGELPTSPNNVAAVDNSIAESEGGIRVRGVQKSYPGTRALAGVSMDIARGEIHGLCGGNGSGKSTLIKILSGVVSADAGEIVLDGTITPATDLNPKLSEELGIRVVHQDLAVFLDLSVAENLRLGTSGYPRTRTGSINWRRLRRETEEHLKRFEIRARPETLLRDLPVATRTQVAIARALHNIDADRGLIIFDEPTAALPVHEAEMLHGVMRRLAKAGHSILFVSHRLDEVLALTDRVTVFRDGSVMSQHKTEGLNEAELIAAILGNAPLAEQEASTSRAKAPVLLDIENLTVSPLKNVNIEVHAGEILGVAGLLGSGRTELLRAIYGDLPTSTGTITFNGRRVRFARSEQAIGSGIVMVPEDRARGGAFQDMSLDDNLSIGVLKDYWRWHGFRRGRMTGDARTLRSEFNIRAASGDAPMSSLSGGNQQKAILARWLRRNPMLLLLDEPTQGVDVGARADIYVAIRKVTEAGGAALLVTSDLEELSQVADRAVVLKDGGVAGEVQSADLTAQLLNELIYSRSNNDTH